MWQVMIEENWANGGASLIMPCDVGPAQSMMRKMFSNKATIDGHLGVEGNVFTSDFMATAVMK